MTAFVVGLLSWTLLEYGLHRFVFHERHLGVAAAREHTEHHAKVSWFAPWSSKLLLAVVLLVPLVGVGLPLLGFGAVAWAVGVVCAWLAYEWLHRRLHTHGPLNAYGRWARRHHFFHHFRDPHRNYGVSSPVWDVVFGTRVKVEQVVVPARQAEHLPWLLGPDGEVRPEVAADFALGLRRGNL
jgi:sterol desaturase/sphingolipid hydroxylase (fatty acid hydroxylase superfamily)